jgi:hypothetical protein
MAITSIKTGSSFTNLTKYDSFLAGNPKFVSNSYESISTVTVGSGGSSSIDFTSIPSTYTHLQIRGIARGSRAATQDTLKVIYNNDSAGNYFSYHEIYGDGSSAAAYNGNATNTNNYVDSFAASSASANIFGAMIIDILDYTNTNKYKTNRFLGGNDRNGSGSIAFGSGLWMSTSAITRITISAANGNLSEYSQFALYGIKGS